jgi:hypothetical protein
VEHGLPGDTRALGESSCAPQATCGELAAVVAIEQNNNYIELGEKVFGERCSEANSSAKQDCFSSDTVGRRLLEGPSCVRLMTADVADWGGKLQFLQGYHAGRLATYCLMLAGPRAAESLRPADTSFFNPSASNRCLG